MSCHASDAPGSSPRGRGKRVADTERQLRVRLIPAWAGKTVRALMVTVVAGAHPRVGGENSLYSGEGVSVSGSSPRGRGKPRRRQPVPDRRGLIPAWAGKTEYPATAGPPRPAHPRVGGENTQTTKPITSVSGSSPRGRGKHQRWQLHADHRGLIPAWAGKTSTRRPTSVRARAHPRVGGENVRVAAKRRAKTGSSPRGRGKRDGRPERLRARRLIPAWAGKTESMASIASSVRAHPRVGGENLPEIAVIRREQGSSPRGRGKRASGSRLPRTGGLIPAWAGKTLSDLRFYRADRSDLGNP